MRCPLYAKQVDINNAIHIRVPTVGEVLKNKNEYFSAVYAMTATPYMMMVQLEDAGIDFTTINDFDLFCLLFAWIRQIDTSMIFVDLDLSKFLPAKNEENGQRVLVNPEKNIVIDRVIHREIASTLRDILSLKRENKRPGNKEAKEYMLQLARNKLKRQQRKAKQKDAGDSQLESYISALVNSADFPYNYETVLDITIHQLYVSLEQISHKVQYNLTMHGYYSGTVKLDDIRQENRTWIKQIGNDP